MKRVKLVREPDVSGQEKPHMKITRSGNINSMTMYVFTLFVIAVAIIFLIS